MNSEPNQPHKEPQHERYEQMDQEARRTDPMIKPSWSTP